MPFVSINSMIRVSISSNGAPGNLYSNFSDMSGDGRFVSFSSAATTFDPLVGSNPTTNRYLYIRDTLNLTTRTVSLGFDGAIANGSTTDSAISDDGRFVLFETNATNLVPGESPDASYELYLRDMWTGATIKIPEVGDGSSSASQTSLSGDGRFVVYTKLNDVYRYDMLTNQTAVVSASNVGLPTNGFSARADISRDGRFVAFDSVATVLIDGDGGDSNGFSDVFLRDMAANFTTRVSLTEAEGEANGHSYDAAVSDDGRYVVFTSEADNLAGEASPYDQVFVRDLIAGTTRLASRSIDSGRLQGIGDSGKADISADGRFVVFESEASDLVAGDVNGFKDVFVRDMVTNATIKLSTSFGGGAANGASYGATISDDGRYVTFSSDASNLIRGDYNGWADVFRVSLFATDAADNLIGSDGADTILALGGSDILRGGNGADVLVGGAGVDTLFGENGDDTLDGGHSSDAMNGGAGTDTVSYASSTLGVQVRLSTGVGTAGDAQGDSYAEIENATGSAFADTLVGSSGNNVLDGGAGADSLIGNSGNDIITGGLGKDTLLGGLNNDAFVFESAAESAVGPNRDVIHDFEDAGENDSIVLTGFAGTLSFIGTAAFTAANQVRAVTSGANVLIQINTTGVSGAESEILLANTTLAQIEAADFFL